MCEHLLVLYYLFNTFLSNLKRFLLLQSRSEMQPSNTSRQLKQAQWRTTVPATSAPIERIFSQSGLIIKPNRARLGKKLLCQLVFLKYNINVWPLNVWCRLMTMLSDTALTEQYYLVKIQNSASHLLFQCYMQITISPGEWIGLLRPWLDLKKAWPLASRLSGLGLEHSVLESIPACISVHGIIAHWSHQCVLLVCYTANLSCHILVLFWNG